MQEFLWKKNIYKFRVFFGGERESFICLVWRRSSSHTGDIIAGC
jgi:hypothetical protein